MSKVDEKSFIKENIPVENIDIIDPLGEIRTTAKELWLKDGSPSDCDVKVYWEKAEELLMGFNKA